MMTTPRVTEVAPRRTRLDSNAQRDRVLHSLVLRPSSAERAFYRHGAGRANDRVEKR